MIVGRTAERLRLAQLVGGALSGRGGALVVRGEAGIGKTALLDDAARGAGTMRVLRVVGVESEAQIPFAAVQLLLAGDLHRVDDLPVPQARALHAALGAASGGGDRLMVGVAVLALLSELAGAGPLLCLFDDVQWFDQSSLDVLLFVARRLRSDPVAVVFAVRDGARAVDTAGIDDVRVPRLADGDAAGCSPPSAGCRTRCTSGCCGSRTATRWRSSSWPAARPPRCPRRSARWPRSGGWRSTTGRASRRCRNAPAAPCCSPPPTRARSRGRSSPPPNGSGCARPTSNRPSATSWCG